MAAVVFLDDRLDPFGPTGEDVYTFGSNPIAQAAALTVIEGLERDRIPERAARMGALLTGGLRGAPGRVPPGRRGPGSGVRGSSSGSSW